MRQLITDDLFAMSQILKKLEIVPDPNLEDDGQIFLDVLKKVLENAHLARTEINDFLGDLSGKTGEEFGKLPIKESKAIMKEFKELDGISDFFELAGKLTKQMSLTCFSTDTETSDT